MRTDWGFVHQNPGDGPRMTVSAGANVGERLMAIGDRHYGHPRAATDWLGRVEIAADRIDDEPRAFSGGMRQRLQIARNLVTSPAAGLHGRTDKWPGLPWYRRACSTFCADWFPTLACPRPSSPTTSPSRGRFQRMIVMKDGYVIEAG